VQVVADERSHTPKTTTGVGIAVGGVVHVPYPRVAAFVGSRTTVTGMLEELRSRARAWLSRRFGDSSLPGDLTEVDLRRKIADLEVRKDEHGTALNRLEDEYREAAGRAAVVDEVELPEVRTDLERVIQRYRGRRQAYGKTLSGLQFLQRSSLIAHHGKEPGGDDVDPEDLWTDATRVPSSKSKDLDRILDEIRDGDRGPRHPGVWETGPCHGGRGEHGEGPTLGFREDPLVERVVSAARNDDPIPSLVELLDNEGDLGPVERTSVLKGFATGSQ
jgi:hypothetical protein